MSPKHTMKSLPEMMKAPFYRENRHATALAIPVGLAFPLVGYLTMHQLGPIGGQGSLDKAGMVAWVCRLVAACCLAVSGPKVFDWLSVMFGAERDTSGNFPWSFKRCVALFGAVAVELTVLLIPDPFISGFMFALSTAMNVFSVAWSTVADHKAVHAARKEEEESRPSGDSLSLSRYIAMPAMTKLEVHPNEEPAKAPRKAKVSRNKGPAPVAPAPPRKPRRTVKAAA